MRPYKTGKIKIKGSQGKNLLEWGEGQCRMGRKQGGLRPADQIYFYPFFLILFTPNQSTFLVLISNALMVYFPFKQVIIGSTIILNPSFILLLYWLKSCSKNTRYLFLSFCFPSFGITFKKFILYPSLFKNVN